jgi:predicted glycogen debranching enzyme
MSTEPIRSLSRPARADHGFDAPLAREWFVANGLGGYASGTLPGVPTRRYHGLLVAALPAPRGRVLVLNHLEERYEAPGGPPVTFGSLERFGQPEITPYVGDALEEFRLEAGLPTWRFAVGGVRLERRVVLVHNRNVAHLVFRIAAGDLPVHVSLRPFWHVRPHDAAVSSPLEPTDPGWVVRDDRIEFVPASPMPAVRLVLRAPGLAIDPDPRFEHDVFYRVEAERGYAERGGLRSPGVIHFDVLPGRTSSLTVSVDPWEEFADAEPDADLDREFQRRKALLSRADPRARSGLGAELVLAADTFLIEPIVRESSSRNEHFRTVIAGYPWFTDWGRDTMISLPGLTLATGRVQEGRQLLMTFASALRDGLIPNLFPEGQTEGVYHTADATLWFFHAIDAYLRTSGDRSVLDDLLPKLLDVIEHHRAGTRFGIGVDPADGLLRQGAPGYQLTWMDAKVGDWVVTPRRGKAVEINALWYNALCLAASWVRDLKSDAESQALASLAEQARASFNRRFWNPQTNALFDVVDGESGDDASIRPNQLLAISLPNPALDRARWEAVVASCERLLVTPVGLRSLAPGSEHYHPRYIGDLTARDAAYHNGTVWAWLIGPFLDAWRKVHPDDPAGARRFLSGFGPNLDEACIGSISEIFDAEAPFTSRGCYTQAWSIAEVLRCWVETVPRSS